MTTFQYAVLQALCRIVLKLSMNYWSGLLRDNHEDLKLITRCVDGVDV